MASLTPDQVRKRNRVEAGIRLAAPALDLILALADRVSRLVERDEDDRYPVAGAKPPERVGTRR